MPGVPPLPGLLALSVLILAPAALAAQTVAGRVVEAGSGAPVAGAFVVVLDDAGGRVGAGLTGDDGRFTFVATRPGSYRLRVQRIGYQGVTTEPVAVGRGATVPLVIPVPGEAVALEGLRVAGEGRCVLRPEEGEPTHRLWTEARKALEVAEWTVGGRPLVYDLVVFERVVDAETEVVERETAKRIQLVNDQPFVSDPPDSLALLGYARRKRRGFEYYGPDAAALLSDIFLDTHCFRRVPGGSALAGLAFFPVADTGSDIRGTLWLDRATAELRLLEFRYVRPPIPIWVDPETFGGTIRFARLPDGAWIIDHWKIRSPMFTLSRRGTTLSSFSETEGSLLALREPDGDPIPHRRDGARLVGQVILPNGLGGAAGAAVRLVGTPFELEADESGRFGIDGLPAGRYRLEVRHPALGDQAWTRVVELRRGGTTRVRVAG